VDALDRAAFGAASGGSGGDGSARRGSRSSCGRRLQVDERGDHYLGLAGANVVATQALLSRHENLADVVEQRAMMSCTAMPAWARRCRVWRNGTQGSGKTTISALVQPLRPAMTSKPDATFNGLSAEEHQDPHRPQLDELCKTESLTTSCGLSR
jgi:hypothetical protein